MVAGGVLHWIRTRRSALDYITKCHVQALLHPCQVLTSSTHVIPLALYASSTAIRKESSLIAVILADFATAAERWDEMRVMHAWDDVPADWESLGNATARAMTKLHIALTVSPTERMH